MALILQIALGIVLGWVIIMMLPGIWKGIIGTGRGIGYGLKWLFSNLMPIAAAISVVFCAGYVFYSFPEDVRVMYLSLSVCAIAGIVGVYYSAKL